MDIRFFGTLLIVVGCLITGCGLLIMLLKKAGLVSGKLFSDVYVRGQKASLPALLVISVVIAAILIAVLYVISVLLGG